MCTDQAEAVAEDTSTEKAADEMLERAREAMHRYSQLTSNHRQALRGLEISLLIKGMRRPEVVAALDAERLAKARAA